MGMTQGRKGEKERWRKNKDVQKAEGKDDGQPTVQLTCQNV